MAVEISVPKLSATMEEAKVLRWLKQPGEPVREGDVLLELETDKAALEVEAIADGTLVEQRPRPMLEVRESLQQLTFATQLAV